MKFLSQIKRFQLNRLSVLILFQLLLVSCGGGGGDSGGTTVASNGSSMANLSAISVVNSSSVSSRTSDAAMSVSSSQSSTLSSSQTSSELALIDASNQFTAEINNHFYVYQSPSEQGVLRYLPKRLALSGIPGIASVQRTDKVSDLLQVFLDLSDADWTSADQVTFSSKFTLDVDVERLRHESEAAGYTKLSDLKVKPPVMAFEQRYVTSLPEVRVQVQCKNLTLLVDGNEVTLHDCTLGDTDGIVATQTINNVASFKYEQLNFDPEAITANSSLRGTLTVDYTLPGTREFDRILSMNSGDLQDTWQLHFNWPLASTSVSSTTVTINWKMLLADFKTLVSAGAIRWDESTINTFISSEINQGAITFPTIVEPTPALKSVLTQYIKQELFVAIYLEDGSSPTIWAPKLRFKNINQPNTQQIALRYFDSELSVTSRLDLSCLTQPDGQNNIYKSSICVGSATP